MKKLLLAVLIVASIPAHAINAHYREQLERSGCTEQSTLQGCDINATKEFNERKLNIPTYSLEGLTLQKRDGGVYVDDKPGIVMNITEKATTYSQGVNTFVVYNSGKVALIRNGKFIGWMNKGVKSTPVAVSDRLHAIKLKGNDSGEFIVSIGNGFTKAMIADVPAKITRKNPNWYEITNSKYVIGVYLSETGVSSASWNYHHGKTHGDFVLVEGQ